MIAYYLQILFLLLAGLFFRGRKKKQKGLMAFSLFLVLFSLMAFRGISVGVDTHSYYMMFKDISKQTYSHLLFSEEYRYEIVFALFMKTSSLFFDSYFFFQAIFSIIFCYLAIRFIYKCTDDLFFCGLIFMCCGLYLGTFNIQRQMLAVVILLNGWYSLIFGNKIKAILIFVIAEMIHVTAAIFLIVYVAFILCKRFNWVVKILPLAMLGMSISYKLFLQYSSPYMMMFNNYLDNHKDTQEAGGVYIIWGIISLLSIYIIYVSGKKTTYVSKLAGVFALQYVFFNLIGLEFNYLERLGTYFLPFSLIVYEQMSCCIKNRSIAYLFKIAVGISYLFYYYLSFNSEQYHYSTYI